jgi:bifunctional non-homologous end joining protein LigD
LGGSIPRIVRSLLALRVQSVALDGEVVWLGQDGVSDFDALHSRKNDEWAMLLAFDLIELDGQDFRDRPLLERKHHLQRLLARADHGLQYVEHLRGDGPMIFEEACRMGLEGIVSKRVDSIYRGGQSMAWLKVKNREHPAYMRVVEALNK